MLTSPPPRSMYATSASFASGCAFGSKISRFHTGTSSIPSPPITANTECQPSVWISHPMSGAKMTVAAYCAELKIALAVPRSFAGNHAATTRLFAGNDGASAAPTRKRSANRATTAVSPVRKPTAPASSVNSDQRKRLAAYTRLEP